MGNARVAKEGEVHIDRAGVAQVRQRRAEVGKKLLLEGGVGKPPTELGVTLWSPRGIIQQAIHSIPRPVERSTAAQTLEERSITQLS